MGKTLVRSVIQTSLKSPENRFGISGGTDTQQTEMVNGQIHQEASAWGNTVGRIWISAH